MVELVWNCIFLWLAIGFSSVYESEAAGLSIGYLEFADFMDYFIVAVNAEFMYVWLCAT
jgi:hypothetical protein